MASGTCFWQVGLHPGVPGAWNVDWEVPHWWGSRPESRQRDSLAKILPRWCSACIVLVVCVCYCLLGSLVTMNDHGTNVLAF